eukprot:2217712-Rhodomonas_salina.3
MAFRMSGMQPPRVITPQIALHKALCTPSLPESCGQRSARYMARTAGNRDRVVTAALRSTSSQEFAKLSYAASMRSLASSQFPSSAWIKSSTLSTMLRYSSSSRVARALSASA